MRMLIQIRGKKKDCEIRSCYAASNCICKCAIIMYLFWLTLVLFLCIQDIEIGKCELLCTDRPPRVRYAILRKIDIHNGASLNYACLPGFYLAKNGTLKCIEGRWHGRGPVCKESYCTDSPPQVTNARLTEISKHNGAIMTYICDPDFYKAEYGTIKCIDGIWRGKSPVCKQSRCYISDAKFPGIVPLQRDIYMHDEAITPQCSDGYVLSNAENGVMRCFNGEWKGAIPPCVLQRDRKRDFCIYPPPSLSNGKIQSFSELHGSSVNYVCDESFILKNSSEPITCEFGQWKGKVPECKRTNCEVSILENGEFESANSFRRFFRPYNETIYRAMRLHSEDNSGTRLYVRCRKPYTFNGNSSAERVLVVCEKGQWNPHPICLRQTECPKLETSKNLTITYTNNMKINSKAIFHCAVGSRRKGATNSTCLANGEWSESPAYCTPIACSIPENPENGRAKYDSLEFGAKLSYECNEGFRPDETQERICGFSGKWSGSRPTCIGRLRSTTPNPDVRGCEFIMKTDESTPIIISERKTVYKFGEDVIFVCPRGKSLFPNIQRVICLGFDWSDDFPECRNNAR